MTVRPADLFKHQYGTPTQADVEAVAEIQAAAQAKRTDISFRLTLNPPTTTHQAKQIVKAGKFTKLADKPGLSNARALYCALLSSHRPKEPLRGPLRLTIQFVFPFRASESKRITATGNAPHVARPDCSNLAKTFEDCLAVMGFMANDSQVCELNVSKRYGSDAGVSVKIEPITFVRIFDCHCEGNKEQ